MDSSFMDYDSIAKYFNDSVLDLPKPPKIVLNSEESIVKLRRHSEGYTERISSHRFSMANLNATHESELDNILDELSLLEQIACPGRRQRRSHSRSNSTISGATTSSISYSSESGTSLDGICREPRSESPDNDSAFSDTVSLLSSESSVSSNVSTTNCNKKTLVQKSYTHQINSKAAKIQLALHKLEHASVRRLFVKAFTSDGASKSILVDERMTCGHVTRLLANKNHVRMEAHWALVENLSDLHMERLLEDHELLVDNIMTWNTDSKNKLLFLQRIDKKNIFTTPELFLPGIQMAPGSQHDEQTKAMLLEDFFESDAQLQIDGPLYMKSDSKKAWKRYHFVLRDSSIYYFPREKTKCTRDLICLTLLSEYNLYRGIGWKKKFKSPYDYTFGLKLSTDLLLGKTCRTLKMLCAEDLETMEKWIVAIRIAKYGKQLWSCYKSVIEDINKTELENIGYNKNESVISFDLRNPLQSTVPLSISNGRISRTSSSSSSGCLSDDNNGFDSEFTTGTIKRKPSMKPNLPLTSMTRQLKEVGEKTVFESASSSSSPDRSGTLTRHYSRRKSQEINGSGTLKKRQFPSRRDSHESINLPFSNSTSTLNSSITTTIKASIDNYKRNERLSQSMLDSIFCSLSSPFLSVGGLTMSSSSLSLNSLPPPPLPNELLSDMFCSQASLTSLSLPPPPPDSKIEYASHISEISPNFPIQSIVSENVEYNLKPTDISTYPSKVTFCNLIKPTIKSSTYKSTSAHIDDPSEFQSQHCNTVSKTVSFADSPVLLRRKFFSTEQSKSMNSVKRLSPNNTETKNVPVPPPRANDTRLSANVKSPKMLIDSAANPARDFLKDLQRVMRKKWQVAEKCKLEPATTPHEVLGFRDFSEGLSNSTHFYRKTANVSNWVQEHYGSGAEFTPYENFNNFDNHHNLNEPSQISLSPFSEHLKKRPPPPPKRSELTHLTPRI